MRYIYTIFYSSIIIIIVISIMIYYDDSRADDVYEKGTNCPIIQPIVGIGDTYNDTEVGYYIPLLRDMKLPVIAQNTNHQSSSIIDEWHSLNALNEVEIRKFLNSDGLSDQHTKKFLTLLFRTKEDMDYIEKIEQDIADATEKIDTIVREAESTYLNGIRTNQELCALNALHHYAEQIYTHLFHITDMIHTYKQRYTVTIPWIIHDVYAEYSIADIYDAYKHHATTDTKFLLEYIYDRDTTIDWILYLLYFVQIVVISVFVYMLTIDLFNLFKRYKLLKEIEQMEQAMIRQKYNAVLWELKYRHKNVDYMKYSLILNAYRFIRNEANNLYNYLSHYQDIPACTRPYPLLAFEEQEFVKDIALYELPKMRQYIDFYIQYHLRRVEHTMEKVMSIIDAIEDDIVKTKYYVFITYHLYQLHCNNTDASVTSYVIYNLRLFNVINSEFYIGDYLFEITPSVFIAEIIHRNDANAQVHDINSIIIYLNNFFPDNRRIPILIHRRLFELEQFEINPTYMVYKPCIAFIIQLTEIIPNNMNDDRIRAVYQEMDAYMANFIDFSPQQARN